MSKFVDYKHEVVRHTHEHEVFLGFTDDAGARAFREWWDEEGERKLLLWCVDKEEHQHLFKWYVKIIETDE